MHAPPARVLHRTVKGWKTPGDTIVISGASRFRNPFTFAMAYELGYAREGDTEAARQATYSAFQEWINGNRSMWDSDEGRRAHRKILDGLPGLRGKNIACRCPLPPEGQPDYCHGVILLRRANRPETTGGCA